MDTNTASLDSLTPSTELKVVEETTALNAETETKTADVEKPTEIPVQQNNSNDESTDTDNIEIVFNEKSVSSIEEKEVSDLISDPQTVFTSDTTDVSDVIIPSIQISHSTDSLNNLNSESVSDNISHEDVTVEISNSEHESTNNNFETNKIISNEVEINLIENEEISNNHEIVSITDEECIKEDGNADMETMSKIEESLLISDQETIENDENNLQNQESSVEHTTEHIDINSSESNIDVDGNTNNITPEIMLDGMDLVEDNIDGNYENPEVNAKALEDIQPTKEQVETINSTVLEKETIDVIIDQEFPTIVQEEDTGSKETPLIMDESMYNQESNEDTRDKDVPPDIITGNTINERDILSEAVHNSDAIEEQISNLVEEEPPILESGKSVSIADVISRDFDETDTEEMDKIEDTTAVKSVEVPHDNVMVDQLQHGTVTVTDTSGHIYYVESVEDLIVVENDIPTTIEQSETYEVTVLSENDEPPQPEAKPVKRGIPPIPSHILGRNIEKPGIDTFRNGKIPPKPRLGVKIPYKNLTSQIVSKDEIAKEILERQKQKYKQAGQSTREILFAKGLTQRLAKKIAPVSGPSKPSQTMHITTKGEVINNSDLLAILEGDGENSEVKRAQDVKTVNVSNIRNSGAVNVKRMTLTSTDTKTQMSKMVEREIALKQLNELPGGPRRRKAALSMYSRKPSNISAAQIKVVENDLEGELENLPSQNEKQGIGKLNDKQQGDAKATQSKAESTKTITIAAKDVVQIKPSTEENSMTELKSDQTKTKLNEISQPMTLTAQTEIEDTNTTGIKEATSDESVKPESTNQAKPNDVPQNISPTESKQEQTDVQEKITDVVKETAPKTTVPHNTVQVAVISGIKSDEKVKKVEGFPKIISAKVIETTKVVDPLSDEFIPRKHTGNPPVKTYTRKRKSTEDISIVASIPDKKPTVGQPIKIAPPNTYVTKSSRIIKRKVIWDPDVPSTSKSLSTKTPKVGTTKFEKSPQKFIVKTEIRYPTRVSDSQKIKKRLSEVDRLLMDEGAVNMLYAFKNDDAPKKKKAGVISLDRAQRELMNKTNELKKDLKINSEKISPKSLRRKESPVPTPTKKVIIPASVSRKKSKDSNRSSLHSPPASPSMVYLNHAEASRIIRRHSSSSYSSLEGDSDADRKAESDVATSTDQEKSNKRRLAAVVPESSRSKRTRRGIEKDNAIEGDTGNQERNVQIHTSKYEKYQTISVKQTNRMVQIILLPSFNNEAYLTPEILNELCSILKELQDDHNCNVVLVSSSATSFCHGINYKTLLGDKEQSRKAFARKLATCVTNFLRVLATFPKILVAGVHGDTVGLGVTILPLFDMVVASDTATFSVPNARLGCAAEGGSLLSLPHLMHNVLVSELLYASRKLIAAEALRLGMVTRVLWPDKFQQELVSIVRSISNQSPQFMELTKKQLRQHMTEHIEEILSKEIDTLTQHWTSSECQKNFGVYG